MDERERYRWIADHVLPFELEVRRWLRRKAHSLSSEDVDDLVQEGYARLWRTDFSAIKDGRSYFYSIVHHVWQDQLRRSSVVQIECIEDAGSIHVDEAPGPEQHASARQQFERLVQIVQKLPRRRREVFEATQFSELSTRETARRMNIAEKTAEMHLHYALVQVTQSMFCEEQSSERTSEKGRVYDTEANKRG